MTMGRDEMVGKQCSTCDTINPVENDLCSKCWSAEFDDVPPPPATVKHTEDEMGRPSDK
jgi:hypothetical protein